MYVYTMYLRSADDGNVVSVFFKYTNEMGRDVANSTHKQHT